MESVTCLDVHGNKHQTPTSSLQWRPAAYGILIHGDQVLLLRQFGDRHDFPGGGLELGEDPKAAVIREVKEETGIDACNPTLLGAESSFFHAAHSDGQSYHSLLLYYRLEFAGGELSKEGLDEAEKQYADGAEWVPVSSVDKLKVGSTVDFRPYIEQAVSAAKAN